MALFKSQIRLFKDTFSVKEFNKYKANLQKINYEYKLTGKKSPTLSNRFLFLDFSLSKIIYLINLKLFGVASYDLNAPLIYQYLAIPYVSIRRILLFFINKLDSLIILPYGERNGCNAPRIIHYGGLKIKTFTSTNGLDKRCKMWKRSALSSIIETLLTSKEIKNKKINFLEIGAASGIVSLFLAKWLISKDIPYEIICIEPNLENVAFLEDSALRNKLNIKIIPLAYGLENTWVEFSNIGSKGLVGENAQKFNTSKNIKFLPTKKPMSEIDFLNSYIYETNFCYIDALLNEEFIIKDILEKNNTIKYFLIEFDNGLPYEIEDLFKSKNFFIIDKENKNYLFSKN